MTTIEILTKLYVIRALTTGAIELADSADDWKHDADKSEAINKAAARLTILADQEARQ